MTIALIILGLWLGCGLLAWCITFRGWLKVRRANLEDLAMLPIGLLLGPYSLLVTFKNCRRRSDQLKQDAQRVLLFLKLAKAS